MTIRATVLLNDLLASSDDFFNHIRRYTASVASILSFGHRGPTYDSFWAHVGNQLSASAQY
jgi:hypothetical protein